MKETLPLNVTVKPPFCANCQREPEAERLKLTVRHEGTNYDIVICRPCIAEHAPSLLEELESAA